MTQLSARSRRPAVLIIADGLGDRPVRELNDLTPLEAARTPHLDALCAAGLTGLVDPYRPGVPVGTDVGTLCALGYDPEQVYNGRGPMEALGAGIFLKPGDVAFRCNFATIDADGTIRDRRAGRVREEARELAASLDGLRLEHGVTVSFRAATEHRAVLVLHGEGLNDRVADVDPGATHEGERVPEPRPLDPSVEAGRTSRALREFLAAARRVLAEHPANEARVRAGELPVTAILTRGAGQHLKLPALSEIYGLRGLCVAGEATVLGIAHAAGLETCTSPKFTANLDTDVLGKAQAAAEALAGGCDFVLLHFKGTDIAGHDNRPDAKRAFIERIDEAAGWLTARAPERTLFAMTADHSTPCAIGEHSGDPVPVFISGVGLRRDGCTGYGERQCMAGGLGRCSGRDLFTQLLDGMGVMPKYGA
jgi:2,3-bisphosphoglycerate-independent phosphoglycerate mutase